MSRHRRYRGVAQHQGLSQGRQTPILPRRKGGCVRSFKLNANGKIIAARSTVPVGRAGMPSPILRRYELDQFAATTDEKVGGYPQRGDRREKRMGDRLQLIAKKLLHRIPKKLSRWQADVVHDDQLDCHAVRPSIKVGRAAPPRKTVPTGTRNRLIGLTAHDQSSSRAMPRRCMR